MEEAFEEEKAPPSSELKKKVGEELKTGEKTKEKAFEKAHGQDSLQFQKNVENLHAIKLNRKTKESVKILEDFERVYKMVIRKKPENSKVILKEVDPKYVNAIQADIVKMLSGETEFKNHEIEEIIEGIRAMKNKLGTRRYASSGSKSLYK